jgi:drug/metabolite transporter (DMT)-like permease
MKRINVYSLLLFQQLISGGTHIVAKAVLSDIDAATLTFVRTVVAGAGLLAIVWVRSGPLRIDRKDWGQIALLGFLGVALNQFLYLYGMRYSTAANGALLYASTPVFVLVLSRVTGREKITPKKTFGILMAFVGITIVIFERGIDFSSGYAFGNLLILIAVIAWTLFTVLGSPMILKYGALKTTSAMMLFGALIFSPFGIFSSLSFPFVRLTSLDWAGILYLALGTSLLGYLLWYHALSRIEASKVAVFANIQPVIATILSLVFLNYTITPPFVIGSIITIVAIYITQVS